MRVVVWITEGTWQSCVDAAARITPPDADVVLLHVLDTELGEVVHGTYDGLLGRAGHDPSTLMAAMADTAEQELLTAAKDRLGRPCETAVRAGHVQHEVVAACEDADLLVCARDGEHDHPGPASIGHHTRFVVDHASSAVLLVWPG
jgi:nucleotide-binding universal stress UspA family protein